MHVTLKSICVVRLSALGDVLMLVPLIRTLQAYLPLCKLTWVISRPAYDLVSGIKDIEFVVIEKNNNPLTYLKFAQQFKNRKFDVLLATQSSFRANLLYPFIRAKRKIGFDNLRAKDLHSLFINERIEPGNDHTLDGFLKFAESLGIREKKIRWDLPSSKEDNEWVSANLPQGKPLVVINPAASKSERSWPCERYIEVINYLQNNYNATVVLTGGPSVSDKQFETEILNQVAVISLIGKTRPSQLLLVLKQADLVICPDTGPSHMAVSVGTPVIALHAVTSSEVSGPYTCRHLAVDCYKEAVELILKTPYGAQPWGTHVHGVDTMNLVRVDGVISKVNEVLGAVNIARD